MKRNVFRCFFALCMLSIFMVASVHAHNLWMEKDQDKVHVLYGHPGHTDPYPAERIVRLIGYTDTGWKAEIEPVSKDGQAFAYLTDDYPALGIVFDNWYWYHTEEDGWRQLKQPEGVEKGLTMIEEGASYKYSKHISRWEPWLAKPLGMRTEAVPLMDPTKLKEGDLLPVQFYFEGQVMPVKGSKVALSSDSSIEEPEQPARTDLEPVMIKIGPPGLQIISGAYYKPLTGKKIAWHVFTLTFETTK